MIPSCSTNSANFSGVPLKDRCCGTELKERVAKILPPTLKQRSSPHCRFSVACGKERQKRRMDSTLILWNIRIQCERLDRCANNCGPRNWEGHEFTRAAKPLNPGRALAPEVGCRAEKATRRG